MQRAGGKKYRALWEPRGRVLCLDLWREKAQHDLGSETDLVWIDPECKGESGCGYECRRETGPDHQISQDLKPLWKVWILFLGTREHTKDLK